MYQEAFLYGLSLQLTFPEPLPTVTGANVLQVKRSAMTAGTVLGVSIPL
jgi:hypothetical protein